MRVAQLRGDVQAKVWTVFYDGIAKLDNTNTYDDISMLDNTNTGYYVITATVDQQHGLNT